MIFETTIEGFKVQAKIYDEGSSYGIDDGKISKLWIFNKESQTVYTYDRGDESIVKGYEEQVKIIKEKFVNMF